MGNAFDLTAEDFHFLVAIGSNVAPTSVSMHDLGELASAEAITLPGRAGGYAAKISVISIAVWLLATGGTHFFRGL